MTTDAVAHTKGLVATCKQCRHYNGASCALVFGGHAGREFFENAIAVGAVECPEGRPLTATAATAKAVQSVRRPVCAACERASICRRHFRCEGGWLSWLNNPASQCPLGKWQ